MITRNIYLDSNWIQKVYLFCIFRLVSYRRNLQEIPGYFFMLQTEI